MTILESAAAVDRLGLRFGALSDDALLEAQRLVGEHRRAVDVVSSAIAGELDRRSARALGVAGLAQRQGFLSTEALIQSVAGGTRADAAKFVGVGAALDNSVVGAAVLAGSISVDAAASIQRGLGAVDATALPLVEAASTVDADRLYRDARDLRDALDAASIERREKEQRDLRYLRYSRRPDGMLRFSGLLDPLDGGLVVSALDAVLSPRRGPRFDAAPIVADERSNEQVAADTLVAIVQLAVDADPGTLFGARRPAVRVVVTGDRAHTEDHHDPVSLATVNRLICDTGVLPIVIGDTLDLGRTQRLFSTRQRIALAVRDGGCRHPDCDRPPSWCEAHHIIPWSHGGRTDTADGILLCRRHHLLIHNLGHHVARDGTDYWLVDGVRRRLMPGKSRVLEKQVS